MPQSDLFIPLHPRHFAIIEHCVDAIQKHIATSINRLCIVSAELPPPLKDSLAKKGATFLNENEPFNYAAADLPIAFTAYDDGGKLFSQLLKWELRRFSKTPDYLVIDANTILLKPLELEQNSIPIRFRQNLYRFSQIMCFNWCFGLIPNAITPFATDIVSLNINILNEMTGKIQARFNLPWHQALLGILQQVKNTFFNFAEIYGYYAALNHPQSFISQTLRTRRLPLNKFPNHPTNLRQSQTGGAAILRYSSDPTPTQKKPVIRMATLGHNGRFANQLFQYAFLRLYANQHQLQVECPPWIGNNVFGHNESQSDRLLPLYREDKGETENAIRFNESHPLRDFEIWGYFQDTARWTPHKDFFRSLFQPLPHIRKPIDDALARIRADRPLIALHLRRGDFKVLTGPACWIAPETWYLNWLETIWPTLENPLLYIATDDPQSVLPHFAPYHPITDKQLGVNLTGAEFYVDFYALSQADILGISNSTFSFAAAMMNQRAKIFTRPDPHQKRMIPFDPWQSTVLLQDQTSNSIPPAIAA